jgi:hypothetical protein
MFQNIDFLHHLLMETATTLLFIGFQQPINLLTYIICELLFDPTAAVVAGDLDKILN